ncbi:MAG TPA: hypothetical protein DCP47_03085, partial [Phycisphaerales bacterium]|nr:hypothetical protein [Phycisphaerales bacterium]
MIQEEAQQAQIIQQSPQQTIQADREIEHHLEKPTPVPAAVTKPVIKQQPQIEEKEEEQEFVSDSYDGYVLPPLDLLIEPEYNFGDVQDKIIKAKS